LDIARNFSGIPSVSMSPLGYEQPKMTTVN